MKVATVTKGDGKKLTLITPNKNRGFTTLLSHESLSVLRSWCMANGFKIDESQLPKKKVKDEDDDFDFMPRDDWGY